MQCCVPFCENTSKSTSSSEWITITFHGFPSEVHLRAAWLRALGRQDNPTDSAVVCSQHFLNDDICETESGLRQIRTGAIPSAVQVIHSGGDSVVSFSKLNLEYLHPLFNIVKKVCMICLDTDSKILLMSKHKLEEAYEKLTGRPLCDQGNLKLTLCVQCARRLINFSRFRDKCLRARALMMDLVGKHELITRKHIKMMNRTKHQLKSNLVLTTLGPDHCDLHILEQPSEDNQKELEETRTEGVIKTEGSDKAMWVEEDMGMKHEVDNYFIGDPLKCESATFQCTLCLEEFVHEHAYMQHMCMHLQAEPSPSAYSAQTSVSPLPASLARNNEIKASPNEAADTHVSCQYKRLTDCVVKLYDDDSSKESVPRRDGEAVMQSVSQNMPSKDISHQVTSGNAVSATEYVEPDTNTVKVVASKTLQSETDCSKNAIDIQCSLQNSSHVEEKWFCDVCRIVFKRKSTLVKHIKTHGEVRRFTCNICQYKFKHQSDLKYHMFTHTGERPFLCKLCDYRSARKSCLLTHIKIHLGIKPFSCKLCNYKCTTNSDLVKHMRTHTDIKPFSCKLCDYECKDNSSVVKHMRSHTGEKPFLCDKCDYKCALRDSLDGHMRTHTGEKPYSCELCDYKCAHKGGLTNHMRTHTGIKPFSCELCDYKCTTSSNLVSHMRTHTGVKPFSCEICDYKCAHRATLVSHMRTHTGERPFSCTLCDYKCATTGNLVTHMRTHTGEKRYSCKLCEYKCKNKNTLMKHMRTHAATDEQPSSWS